MALRPVLTGLAAFLAVAIAVPARAQSKDCSKPTPADSETAHQKYIAGKVEYDEGNYDAALKRFKEAYSLDCAKHELLIIISAAQEKKGDRAEAIKALEDFVAKSPNAQDVGTYKTRIENLKQKLASAQPPPAPPPPTTTQTPPPPTPPQRPPPPHETSGGHTPWPWVVVGIGGAAMVTGAIVFAVSPAVPANCNETTKECTRRPGSTVQEDQDAAEQAVNQPKIGIGVLAGGGALVLGGLIWHFLEPTGSKSSARVSPMVAPGYGGAAFGGTF